MTNSAKTTRSTRANSPHLLVLLQCTGLHLAATAAFALPLAAQTVAPTGPQQLTFAGLRSVASQGQINAVGSDGAGNLYLLLNQNDGVRLLKTDPTATTVLAQALLGAQGDIGLALAIDPSSSIYITGTTTSGALGGTSGAAFNNVADTSTNSFVAKYDSALTPLFVTLCGGGRMSAVSIAATADAAFVTGSVFGSTLPVTPAGITQAPAFGSTQNGFVEKFSANGSALLYATYLGGFAGNTAPAAIAADASDNAYIAGYTSSLGYPTIAALVPAMLTTAATGTSSGFLTKLTPAGDGITFSTYIPGSGIASLALDPVAQNLLLSGNISLGQFPIATVAVPIADAPYQSLLRISLDGSTVLASTLLAPATQSFVTPGLAGNAWVDGMIGIPLLPLTPLATIGSGFAMRVNAQNAIDQTARFGGLASENPANASMPVTFTSIAIDPTGQPIFGGAAQPSASSSLLATETYDLPFYAAPTPALPSTLRTTVLAPGACSGSLCSGSAAYIAKLTTPTTAAPALALSVDDSPNLTLRNLGSAQAIGLQIAATGFTSSTNCGATLAAGGECSIALAGLGPGSVTVEATNATTQTTALPALASGTIPAPVVFSPKELDFGIVSSARPSAAQTITVTNLTQSPQTFTSAIVGSVKATTPYTFSEVTSDCSISEISTNKVLAPGGVCHISLGLTASTISTNDGPIQAEWSIGNRAVALTAFGQAAALSVSAAEVDFGTQYANGLRLPRYLYLSNASSIAASHTILTLPASSPFTLTDRCPSTLGLFTICQLQLSYQASHTPSSDSVTLNLDQGLTVLVTGESLPQPTANGSATNPNLSVSATALTFPTAVVVTGVSAGTQTLAVANTGNSAFTLALTLNGDFTDTTSCGASLPAHSSCSIVVAFAPSAPGIRDGLIALTAGAGTTPAYVTLTGTGTTILSPANNGTLNFGSVIVGQPSVQWIKITQSFSSFAFAINGAVTGAPFTAILVEDIGYGHGQPASTAFTASAKGTCFNCWLGVQFTPVSTGTETALLSLTSSATGNPYLLALAGTGLPLTGLILTPITLDFGPIAINSTSAPSLFTLTNLVPGAATLTVSAPTIVGDFSLSSAPSGGAVCGGALAYTDSCFIEIAFSPTAPGDRTGSLTLSSGTNTATAALTGFGSPDPGLSISPTALNFTNVPGPTATHQTVTLLNTDGATIQVAAPTLTSTNFAATTNCATLTPGQSCTITVTFTPGAGPASSTLQIPVAATLAGVATLATYTVPLTGTTTTQDAGLQIIAAQAEYGPQATGSTGVTRQFTVNNLTAKSLTLSLALPRQFVLAGAPCSALAPNASCDFAVTFLPLTNGDITGTLFAQAIPSDNSATLNGLAYVEGYGVGTGILSVSGLSSSSLLNFGQLPSGQSIAKTLTLTNSGPAGSLLTISRVTSEWPFLATTTCGATLAATKTCTVTLIYTPLNQVATEASPPPSTPDAGTLILESDAVSSPTLIDLSGTSTPAYVAAPSYAAPLAGFALSQSSLTFDTTMAGNASTPQTVSLSNTGTATLRIASIATSTDFVASTTCATLLPGANCTLTIVFTPQSTSTSTTRISAVEISSDSGTPLEFISLIGAASPPTLFIPQNTLSFGTVLVGANASLPLQITNVGTAPVTFNALSATGDFIPSSGSCPVAGGTLAPNTSCNLEVEFTPFQTGTHAGILSISTSASTLPITASLTGIGAQSLLQVSPSTLNFGSLAVGVSASLPLTLVNTGNAPVTNIVLTITGDYAVTLPCASTTLAPGASCPVTITFTPNTTGTRTGTLTVTSSDPASPTNVPLIGNGIPNGTFTFTIAGGTTASATVKSGTPAAYSLTLTPINNFSGTVVLNCTPIAAAQYASCSLLPSSITLAGAPQNSVATINTVTSVASASTSGAPSLHDTALCLLFPGLIVLWKARTSRHRAWRRIGPAAWSLLSVAAMLSASGCGHPSNADPNLRYVTPGTYTYQVTASSVSAQSPQITQTVTLTLIVQ
jgi:hypothetical protein